jgi:CRP/FNR family transcriptional regulator, cyclic AMP receptor protein
MTKVDDFNKFDFFNAFSKDQLAGLAKVTETKTFKKGSEIYKEGDRANNIFIVTKGWVSLRKVDPERDLGIAFENREKGELFGTACFMKPQEYIECHMYGRL